MSSSNPPEPSSEIFSFGGKREMRQANDPEKRKNDTNAAPYSRNRIGILSVLFSAIVGAFMLADNYEMLGDSKTAKRLRFGFLIGVPVWWFLLDLISVVSPTAGRTGPGTTVLTWVVPLSVLDVLYRRWREQWVETNGDIVSGNGSGRALLYIGMLILVFVGYVSFAPSLLTFVATTIASAARATTFVATTIASTAPATTFVDSTFSMTYPSSWTAHKDTVRPNCDVSSWECVQIFELPYIRGAMTVTRTNDVDELLTHLSTQEQAVWDSTPFPKTSLRVFETTIGGFTTLQRDFTFVIDLQKFRGAILIVRTDKEIYVITAWAHDDDFPQVEKAIASIQLDVE